MTFSARYFQCIVEIERRRFVDSSVLAENDGVEIVAKSTGCQFLVLYLMETVAAHVHAITLLFEIVHQFMRALNDPRLAGAEVEKLVAHL